jgi:hypothetical protein
VETQRTLLSLALHLNGGNSSGEEVNTSSMSETTRQLKFTKTRMLKDNKLLSVQRPMDGTKDGELSILIIRTTERKELQDLTENMDSISIDSSTSDQDFQCGELLLLLELILNSRDITKEEDDTRHGNSIESPILSSLITPEATQ